MSVQAGGLLGMEEVSESALPRGASPARFKQAMRHLAGTVCVITVADDTERGGLAATSVVSVTAEPAEILVAVNQASSSWPLLARSRRFGVNLLAAEQKSLAMRFAGADGSKGEARYAGQDWLESPEGVWLLRQAPAALACEVAGIWERHSHALVVGRVTAIHLGAESSVSPLLYWQAQYGCFQKQGQA